MHVLEGAQYIGAADNLSFRIAGGWTTVAGFIERACVRAMRGE